MTPWWGRLLRWGFEVCKCLVQAWGHSLPYVTTSMSFFSLHQGCCPSEPKWGTYHFACVQAPLCNHLSESLALPPPFLQPCHPYSILAQLCPFPRFSLTTLPSSSVTSLSSFSSPPGPVPLLPTLAPLPHPHPSIPVPPPSRPASCVSQPCSDVGGEGGGGRDDSQCYDAVPQHTATFFIPLTPQPLAITNLLFASMDLPILHISCKWNHTVWPFISGCFYLA